VSRDIPGVILVYNLRDREYRTRQAAGNRKAPPGRDLHQKPFIQGAAEGTSGWGWDGGIAKSENFVINVTAHE